MKVMRHVKLLAAVSIVLVAISGFSPARGSGGKGGSSSKSHSSGGGGCSSKKSSSHSGSSDSYGSGRNSYDDGYDEGYRRGSRYNSSSSGSTSGSSNGSAGRSGGKGTGTVTECAASSQNRPSATVRLRNSRDRSSAYTVTVNFRDGSGGLVDTGTATGTVSANGTRQIKVPMGDATLVSKVRSCELASVR